MADPTVNIQFKTTADTTGAKQAQEAIEAAQKAASEAENIKGSADYHRPVLSEKDLAEAEKSLDDLAGDFSGKLGKKVGKSLAGAMNMSPELAEAFGNLAGVLASSLGGALGAALATAAIPAATLIGLELYAGHLNKVANETDRMGRQNKEDLDTLLEKIKSAKDLDSLEKMRTEEVRKMNGLQGELFRASKGERGEIEGKIDASDRALRLIEAQSKNLAGRLETEKQEKQLAQEQVDLEKARKEAIAASEKALAESVKQREQEKKEVQDIIGLEEELEKRRKARVEELKKPLVNDAANRIEGLQNQRGQLEKSQQTTLNSELAADYAAQIAKIDGQIASIRASTDATIATIETQSREAAGVLTKGFVEGVKAVNAENQKALTEAHDAVLKQIDAMGKTTAGGFQLQANQLQAVQSDLQAQINKLWDYTTSRGR